MDEARETAEGRAEPKDNTNGFNPVKVFVVLVLVAILVMGLALTMGSRNVPRQSPAEIDKNGFALNGEEAVDRFKELDALSRRAYEERDTSLITLYLHTQSPLRSSNFEDIRRLKRNGVYFRPKLEVKRLTLVRNESDEIVVEQRLIEEPRFFSESGKNVTSNPSRLRQTIQWTLKPEDSEWKIFNARVLENKVTLRQ